MLVQKLDLKDLQFEKMYPFDGTMAYAQNKRQQVIMTEQYAKNYPNIHCSCMHPGWADTPGNIHLIGNYCYHICEFHLLSKLKKEGISISVAFY